MKKKKWTEVEGEEEVGGEEDTGKEGEKYLNAQQGAFERDYSHKSINNSEPGRTLASHCPRPTWEQHLAYIIPPSHIKEPPSDPRERRYIIYPAFGGWFHRVIMRLMSRKLVYLAGTGRPFSKVKTGPRSRPR